MCQKNGHPFIINAFSLSAQTLAHPLTFSALKRAVLVLNGRASGSPERAQLAGEHAASAGSA